MELENKLHHELFAVIEAIEKDRRLYEEQHFSLRVQAIDRIEFYVIDRIDVLMAGIGGFGGMNSLKEDAEKVRCDLQAIDTSLFHRLRREISNGVYKGQLLMNLIDKYFDHHTYPFIDEDREGYGYLDLFINGLLSHQGMPIETLQRAPEMVYYQKSPARIILELIQKAKFEPRDVFFDIGSGLGQANILVNLFTGIVSKGVEFEPAFCAYANACAADLNLNDVAFINIDARDADYSEGTVFFMYTPFKGKMLSNVLQKLRTSAKNKKIRLFTYGPCTERVAQEGWLLNEYEIKDSLNELAAFVSV